MRIISNQRDYYDGCMNHDKKDRYNKVWVRKEREIWINKRKLVELEKRHLRISRDGWSTGFLILAGKVIPYVVQHTTGYRNEYGSSYFEKFEYYYDAESANEAHKNEKKPTSRNNYRYWGWGNDIKQDLIAFFAPYSNRDDLCIERQTPIILITPANRNYGDRHNPVRTCYVDVNLQEMQVTKLFDAYQLYQELDVYYRNTLTNDDMVMRPIDDSLKVKIHGFDPKYGFRTRKGVK